ncbi:MAG: hypothetical protein EBU79_10855 [Betaproteobacteria bacterium]|nr:hypothetical protein [Betaproteobacteria bacterium]
MIIRHFFDGFDFSTRNGTAIFCNHPQSITKTKYHQDKVSPRKSITEKKYHREKVSPRKIITEKKYHQAST